MNSNNRQSMSSGHASRGGSPLRWRNILDAAEPNALVFRGFYEEFAGAEASESERFEEDVMRSHEVIVMGGSQTAARQMVVQNDSRLVQVNMPELQLVGDVAPNWGNDTAMIEEWFAEGETLADEAAARQDAVPQRKMERARDWMKSVAAATGLVSS